MLHVFREKYSTTWHYHTMSVVVSVIQLVT